MTRLKSIKHALFFSILSLVLCVSMLVGTTLAYFVDSVGSVNNVISSGTLSVGLEYAKNDGGALTEWQTVEGSSNVFDPHTIWEPGRVEVVYLKISNVGELALKYQLFVNIFSETPGESALGESFKLSDHLVFRVLEMSDGLEAFTDDEAIARVSGLSKGLKNYDGATRRLKASEVAYMAMIVYMPENVGDTVNNYGPNTPRVELGVNLRATQADFESDAYGPDYDKDIVFGATYVENLEDLRDSVEYDDEILINKDIGVTDEDHLIDAGTPEEEYLIGLLVKTDTELHLDKNNFSYVGTKPIDALIHVTGRHEDGRPVRLDLVGGSKNRVYANGEVRQALISADKGALVNIHGGEYSVSEGTLLYADTGAVINVYKGFFEAQGERPLLVSTGVDGAKICLYGGTFVNFDPRTADGGSMVAEGYEVITSTEENGDIWYTVVPEKCETYTPVTDIQSIKDAFASSANGIYISTDISAAPNTESLMYGKPGEPLHINGGGSTITTNGTGTQAGVSSDYGYVAFIPGTNEDATISDLRVTGSGFVEIGDYDFNRINGKTYGVFTAKNLVIEDLVATLHINNGGNNIAPAFSHYSSENCYLIDCVMTGTTTEKDGYKPYDAGFVNGTITTIQGGKYGSIYVAQQGKVRITGAEIETIDSCAITTRNLGNLTIGAGTVVGTIICNPGGSFKPALYIEEGAVVDKIIYQGVTYTQAEWMAR